MSDMTHLHMWHDSGVGRAPHELAQMLALHDSFVYVTKIRSGRGAARTGADALGFVSGIQKVAAQVRVCVHLFAFDAHGSLRL